ncbi:hypothetical protein MAFF211271_00730 [Ralstonia syzygii subsp. indonesiensis]|nr:hypothetical protein MAFF211271_00730 [Ralstonia pseudosolanacearum]
MSDTVGGSSLPPQAASDSDSDSDNQAASDNAADDNGRTCMDFSLNVFLCADGKTRARSFAQRERTADWAGGLRASEYRNGA